MCADNCLNFLELYAAEEALVQIWRDAGAAETKRIARLRRFFLLWKTAAEAKAEAVRLAAAAEAVRLAADAEAARIAEVNQIVSLVFKKHTVFASLQHWWKYGGEKTPSRGGYEHVSFE